MSVLERLYTSFGFDPGRNTWCLTWAKTMRNIKQEVHFSESTEGGIKNWIAMKTISQQVTSMNPFPLIISANKQAIGTLPFITKNPDGSSCPFISIFVQECIWCMASAATFSGLLFFSPSKASCLKHINKQPKAKSVKSNMGISNYQGVWGLDYHPGSQQSWFMFGKNISQEHSILKENVSLAKEQPVFLGQRQPPQR